MTGSHSGSRIECPQAKRKTQLQLHPRAVVLSNGISAGSSGPHGSCIGMFKYVYIYIHIHIYICMYMYMRMYMYMHIQGCSARFRGGSIEVLSTSS